MAETLNLGELISQAVARKLDASFVEKEVETRIGKLVVEAVDSALRPYSDTGTLITQKVSEALRVADLDLPSYGTIVAAMLKEQIEAKVSPLVAGKLAADMDELLSLAPKQIKLSELAKQMIDHRREFSGEDLYGDVITVIVEPSEYSTTWVYLDEQAHHDGHRAKWECRHSLLVGKEDGLIRGATIDKRKSDTTQWIGPAYGLAQKLRAFVACGTVLVLDEEFVVTSVGDY